MFCDFFSRNCKSFSGKIFVYLAQDFDIYLVADFEDNSTVSFLSPYVKEVKNIKIYRNV